MQVSIDWDEGSRYNVGCGNAFDSKIPVCILDKKTGKKHYRIGDIKDGVIKVKFNKIKRKIVDILHMS